MGAEPAFLLDNLDHEVSIELPKEYKDAESSGPVCRLLNAFYGLNQAPQHWFEIINKFLQSVGLKAVRTPIGFAWKELVLDLNDHLLRWCLPDEKAVAEIDSLKGQQVRQFKMEDYAEASVCLRLELQGIASTTPSKSIEVTPVEGLGKVWCGVLQSSDPPMPEQITAHRIDGNAISDNLYRLWVGSMMYITICTRLILSSVVGRLLQDMETPKSAIRTCIKRILHFIARRQALVAARWTGFLQVGFWSRLHRELLLKSQKEYVVTTSTAEAIYLAFGSAVQ